MSGTLSKDELRNKLRTKLGQKKLQRCNSSIKEKNIKNDMVSKFNLPEDQQKQLEELMSNTSELKKLAKKFKKQ